MCIEGFVSGCVSDVYVIFGPAYVLNKAKHIISFSKYHLKIYYIEIKWQKKRVVNTKLCLNLLSQERLDTHALSQQ